MQLEFYKIKKYNSTITIDYTPHKGDNNMRENAKRITAMLALASVALLNACSVDTATDITTAEVPETTKIIEQTQESLARVIEVPYENTSAIFTFNEKGLLISSENCPWGDDNDYYKYDDQNRITEIQHALWDGTIDDGCERNIYIYDENGNINKINTYMGSKEKLTRYRTYDFEYNAEGLLTKEITMAGGNNSVMETVGNEYDENGNLIKSTLESYGETSEVLYEYDENGNCILMNYIDSKGNSSKTVYEYDTEGRLIKESSEDFISNYEYENGLLVKETTENWHIEYKYYDNNRIIAAYFYGNDGIEEINISAVPEVMGNYADLPR